MKMKRWARKEVLLASSLSTYYTDVMAGVEAVIVQP